MGGVTCRAGGGLTVEVVDDPEIQCSADGEPRFDDRIAL